MSVIPSKPVFGVSCSHWFLGNTPIAGPADEVGIMTQPYFPTRAQTTVAFMQLRMDVGASTQLRYGDVWEIPTGSGRYFIGEYCFVVHDNMPNAYWMQICAQCGSNGSFSTADVHLP